MAPFKAAAASTVHAGGLGSPCRLRLPYTSRLCSGCTWSLAPEKLMLMRPGWGVLKLPAASWPPASTVICCACSRAKGL